MDNAPAIQLILQRECMTEIWAELLPLFDRHYDEISANKDIPLQPDFGSYQQCEKNDCLRTYIARVDGKVVGYAIFFVRGNLHYASSLQATNDIIYVVPEMRGTGIGLELVNFSNEQLASEGVQVVHIHTKIAHPQLGNMLKKRCGFSAVETIYSKRLDK